MSIYTRIAVSTTYHHGSHSPPTSTDICAGCLPSGADLTATATESRYKDVESFWTGSEAKDTGKAGKGRVSKVRWDGRQRPVRPNPHLATQTLIRTAPVAWHRARPPCCGPERVAPELTSFHLAYPISLSLRTSLLFLVAQRSALLRLGHRCTRQGTIARPSVHNCVSPYDLTCFCASHCYPGSQA